MSEIRFKVINGAKRFYKVLPNGMWRFVKGSGGGGGRGGGGGSHTASNGGNRTRFSMPSVAGILLLVASMVEFGVPQAVNYIKAGNWNSALSTLYARAMTFRPWLVTVGGGVALKTIRQAVGPVQLMKIGRFSIRAL